MNDATTTTGAPVVPPEVYREAVARLAPVLPVLTDLGARFAAAGHELALVGGPVRDAFLGRASNDLDLTTSARPDDIEPILSAWGDTTWDMGREFGTIGAQRHGAGAHGGDLVVEVTTYRADEYDGQTRKPVVAFGDNLEDDLVRRDFTVNAMALRLPDLELSEAVLRQRLALLAPEIGAFEAALFSIGRAGAGQDPLRLMRSLRKLIDVDGRIAAEETMFVSEIAARLGVGP